MAIEIEVKIRLSDPAEFRARLGRMNAGSIAGRHFEDNLVLDFPHGDLRSRACLLRLRKTQHKESITFKGPPQPSEAFKRREEIETAIDSADALLGILEQLGLRVWFRYQKYREEFTVPVGDGSAPPIHLAIDATPIGDFAELEGSEEGIREVAARLGYSDTEFLRDSYYSLFLQYRRGLGREMKHMVFPSGPEGADDTAA
jgi:adenylate cyclase class 2